jgi:hypothetical protein
MAINTRANTQNQVQRFFFPWRMWKRFRMTCKIFVLVEKSCIGRKRGSNASTPIRICEEEKIADKIASVNFPFRQGVDWRFSHESV